MNSIIENRQSIKELGDSNYICTPCATEKGASWPDKHVATFHHGICHYCGLVTGLASVRDWDWLAQSKRPKAIGAGRD